MKNIIKNNSGMPQNYVNILGIKVLSTHVSTLLAGIRDKITHSSELGFRNKKFYIVTPNPELVLSSTKDPILARSLNSADFAVPDGHGLDYASRYLYGTRLNIIPGRILFEKLIELANKKSWKVFFLGGNGLEAEIAAEKLRINYKKVKIETFAGPKLDKTGEAVSDLDKSLQKDAIDRINKSSPQILFVAFGNPKQEIWIYKNLRYLNIGGSMAVGGTFRYIADMSPLPPNWLANLGLEWLWRLITEPYRLKRIWNAFPIFPLRVFWFKVSGH